MNYCKYIPIDVLNGVGTRCVLFVAGCEHHCKGCYNQSTWAPDTGNLIDTPLINQIITDLSDTKVPRDGITITGGDPLALYNRDKTKELVHILHNRVPTKTIWLYTGYNYEDIPKEYLEYVDILVDGKYIESLKDPKLSFRGSRNQRIIDIPSTLNQGKLVLATEFYRDQAKQAIVTRE